MTFADLGVSLDGFIAGPNRGPENALGDGGHRIHKWVYAVQAYRERQSLPGGGATATMSSPRRPSAAPGRW
jgi:hypothetical protein